MILIDSVYINIGGGKVLLEELINYLIENTNINDFHFLFDSRLNLSKEILNNNIIYTEVNANEASRKDFYKQNIHKFNKFVCLSNVPPPILINSKEVVILFHNALLLGNFDSGFNLSQRLKFFVKKYYIKLKLSKNYKWVVQTEWMKNQLYFKLNIEYNKINIIPFFREEKFVDRLSIKKKVDEIKFLYVADGSPQKNHKKLINAWAKITSINNLKLELHLTIPPSNKKLIEIIQLHNEKYKNIINHGSCNRDKINLLYSNCKYFIFPSLIESFGLPLIEAANAGCEILASNRKCFEDIIIPLVSFEPTDETSIEYALQYVINNPNLTGTKKLIINQINDFFKLIKC